MLEKVCGAQNGAKRNMPRIAFKVFLLIVANAFYIAMGILEEQYYEPMASKNAVKVLDIVMFCLMVLINGQILEG